VVREGASDLAIVAADGGVGGAQPESERLYGDDGTLDQGGIIGKSNCPRNESEAFLNHIAAPSILSVVKTPDGLWAGFLELLERGPLLQ
jgi:hypothetical protein